MLTPEQDTRLADRMRLAQSGDKPAYESLLKEAALLLRRFFAARADSDEAAEDLIQETLVSIHRARHSYISGKPFAPWMYAIARRRLADHWRSRSRAVPLEALDESLEWADSRTSAITEGENPVHETLATLPENQRRVVELLKLSGFSIKEAARHLEISEAAVKVTAHRAYQRLRKTWAQQNDGNQ